MTKKFGIIGDPIKHSLSPVLHNYWFKKYNIDANYSIIQVRENQIPKIIVIGAAGRVGSGACDFFKSLGLKISEWDIKETSGRNSFSEILEHDIFVNCVLSDTKSVKFLKKSDITNKRKLSLISDVSCDPGSDFNTTLSIY